MFGRQLNTFISVGLLSLCAGIIQRNWTHARYSEFAQASSSACRPSSSFSGRCGNEELLTSYLVQSSTFKCLTR
jgi:hypothetical protein